MNLPAMTRARCRHGAHWITSLNLPSGQFWADDSGITVCIKSEFASRPAFCGSLSPHGPHQLSPAGNCAGTADGRPPVYHEPLPGFPRADLG